MVRSIMCGLTIPVFCLLPLGIRFIVKTPRIDPTTYAAIDLGMYMNEVKDLIGEPPGNYMRHGGIASGRLIAFQSSRGPFALEVWQDDDFLIAVGFDRDRRVCAKFLEAAY